MSKGILDNKSLEEINKNDERLKRGIEFITLFIQTAEINYSMLDYGKMPHKFKINKNSSKNNAKYI